MSLDPETPRAPSSTGDGQGRPWRGQSPQERRDSRRRRLLDAALDLFGTTGYPATSLTALWALGLAVLVVLEVATTREVPDWWMGMCCYGIALGLYGVRFCRRRHEAIARDAARGLPRRS